MWEVERVLQEKATKYLAVEWYLWKKKREKKKRKRKKRKKKNDDLWKFDKERCLERFKGLRRNIYAKSEFALYVLVCSSLSSLTLFEFYFFFVALVSLILQV